MWGDYGLLRPLPEDGRGHRPTPLSWKEAPGFVSFYTCGQQEWAAIGEGPQLWVMGSPARWVGGRPAPDTSVPDPDTLQRG